MSERLGAYKLEKTVLSAGYWQKNGHEKSTNAEVSLLFDNSVNHWKNAAYAMAEESESKQAEIESLNMHVRALQLNAQQNEAASTEQVARMVAERDKLHAELAESQRCAIQEASSHADTKAELAEYQNMERVCCIGQLNEYACFELVNNRGYKMSTPLFVHPTKEQGK